jgi:GNAT superfamily N-acetyltransferase
VAVRIRPATRADARGIAEAHVAGWRWAYPGLIPDEILASLSVDEREAMWRDFLTDLTDRSMHVAVDDADNVVGFANTAAARDEGAPPGIGELLGIYLVHEVQGAGVGRALMATALDALRAARCTRAILWVLTTNARARRFYEADGWVWDGGESIHEVEGLELPLLRYARDL